MAKIKRPTDINQGANSIVDIATGEVKEIKEEKNLIKAAACGLGCKGGIKGGNARAKKLSSERRSEIVRNPAFARWNKK